MTITVRSALTIDLPSHLTDDELVAAIPDLAGDERRVAARLRSGAGHGGGMARSTAAGSMPQTRPAATTSMRLLGVLTPRLPDLDS